MAKYKHLTMEDRRLIEDSLNAGMSFKRIGKLVGKDCTTIAKEVRNNHTTQQTGCYGHRYNNCRYAVTCAKSHLCHDCENPRSARRCRYCTVCNSVCPDYKPAVCHILEKAPYVCNACRRKNTDCTLEKHLYRARTAQQDYESLLSSARTGISCSEAELRSLDGFLSPLLRKGQSIHHVYAGHRDFVMMSESTIYRFIDGGLLTARNIDLPRKVRFAPRRKAKEFKVDRACRQGRTYADFLEFRKSHPDLPVTQIDSVAGTIGGKVLLTVHFVRAECMIAFLRDRNDSKSVIDSIGQLYERLTPDAFRTVMPVLLGDNGSEFSNPKALEYDGDGRRRTRVFYCDPSAPYQKGAAERNHEFIRMFLPKGTSFDGLTQEDVDLMMDHINSYRRQELGDRSPYDMMLFMYGKGVTEKLGIHRIPADEVTLKKEIFRKEGRDDAEEKD